MVAYQLSIFAENKSGKLAKVTGVLAREKINIRATTIATADTFGIINLIVDEPERAEKALSGAGMTAHLRAVLAVLIPDAPGALDHLMQLLYQEALTSIMPTALCWKVRKRRYSWWMSIRWRKRKSFWNRKVSKRWILNLCPKCDDDTGGEKYGTRR